MMPQQNADETRKMLHDPVVYADPDHFYPERFIPSAGKLAERNPRSCVFGFGRR
jgi:cytochrome P450